MDNQTVKLLNTRRTTDKEALLEGELGIDKAGCLAIEGIVVVSPRGYTLTENLEVLDNHNQVIGVVGEPMTIGGGMARLAAFPLLWQVSQCGSEVFHTYGSS